MTPERWVEIEELYLRALDLEGDERAALLAKASPEVCGQVQAMLEQPTGSKLMDALAWADTDRSAQSQIAARRCRPASGWDPTKFWHP